MQFCCCSANWLMHIKYESNSFAPLQFLLPKIRSANVCNWKLSIALHRQIDSMTLSRKWLETYWNRFIRMDELSLKWWEQFLEVISSLVVFNFEWILRMIDVTDSYKYTLCLCLPEPWMFAQHSNTTLNMRDISVRKHEQIKPKWLLISRVYFFNNNTAKCTITSIKRIDEIDTTKRITVKNIISSIRRAAEHWRNKNNAETLDNHFQWNKKPSSKYHLESGMYLHEKSDVANGKRFILYTHINMCIKRTRFNALH